MSKVRSVLPYLIIISTLLVYACGDKTANVADTSGRPNREQINGKPGGSLVHRVTSPIKTLNYYMADDEPSIILTLFLLNDRLIALDHEKQEYQPALAESYSAEADGRTVNIVLREGLKFSDGKPLTTADVEFTLKGAYDKRTNSPVIRDSLLVNDKEIGTKIIDERRMQFIFPEKVSAVENYLENLVVLPKHVLESYAGSGKLGEAWKISDDPKSMATSGPFVVDSVETGVKVALKRNPNYWRKDSNGTPLPYLDSIVLEIVPDANNTLARLQQGTIDIADRIRTSDYAALKTSASPAKAFDSGPGLSTDHLWFNLNPTKKNGQKIEGTPKYNWFSDKRFRKAVSNAIDRRSIASNTLQGLATPLYGFVPIGNRAWLDPNLPKTDYDLERSKKLLSEAGFSVRENNGKPELFDGSGNRVEFTMIVPAENEPRKLMAAVIQEDLAKLGMNVQIAPIDFQGLTERWTSSYDYDCILQGLSLTALDPSSFASFLLSSGGAHQWRPKQETPASEWEAKVDQLFADQAQADSITARKEKFNEIQSIFSEEMPIIPVVSRHVVSAANERIGNYSPSGMLPYSMWNADRLFIK
ncbi:MAG: ABC transporter substrate-binding protein [Pyrinomonadaceae bacterium]|nr:ABC transporter substrate-binding protein [Pyrinomonadaceae bacterium]